MEAAKGPPGYFFHDQQVHGSWNRAKTHLAELLPFLFRESQEDHHSHSNVALELTDLPHTCTRVIISFCRSRPVESTIVAVSKGFQRCLQPYDPECTLTGIDFGFDRDIAAQQPSALKDTKPAEASVPSSATNLGQNVNETKPAEASVLSSVPTQSMQSQIVSAAQFQSAPQYRCNFSRDQLRFDDAPAFYYGYCSSEGAKTGVSPNEVAMEDVNMNCADVPIPESDDEFAEEARTATPARKTIGTFASYDSYMYSLSGVDNKGLSDKSCEALSRINTKLAARRSRLKQCDITELHHLELMMEHPLADNTDEEQACIMCLPEVERNERIEAIRRLHADFRDSFLQYLEFGESSFTDDAERDEGARRRGFGWND